MMSEKKLFSPPPLASLESGFPKQHCIWEQRILCTLYVFTVQHNYCVLFLSYGWRSERCNLFQDEVVNLMRPLKEWPYVKLSMASDCFCLVFAYGDNLPDLDISLNLFCIFSLFVKEIKLAASVIFFLLFLFLPSCFLPSSLVSCFIPFPPLFLVSPKVRTC